VAASLVLWAAISVTYSTDHAARAQTGWALSFFHRLLAFSARELTCPSHIRLQSGFPQNARSYRARSAGANPLGLRLAQQCFPPAPEHLLDPGQGRQRRIWTRSGWHFRPQDVYS
jgi:hypothetical protein